MMPDYRRWAFGPEELQRLGAVAMQARVRLACLRHEPEDAAMRSEVVRLAGAIVGHADRESWYALGCAAGALVRLLATRRGDALLFDALECGLQAVEALI